MNYGIIYLEDLDMESNVMLKGVSFNYLLLEYYRKLGINEDQLAVILMVNHLLEQENDVLTSDLLSLKMSFPVEKIDSILAFLVEKGFLEISSKKGRALMSLKPLKNCLLKAWVRDFDAIHSLENDSSTQEIYEIIEKEIGYTLKPTEVERIREWVSELNYEKEMILNVIKDLKNEGRKITVKQIDNKLFQKAKSKEIKSEGKTSITSTYDKNLEESIAITKTKWLDD